MSELGSPPYTQPLVKALEACGASHVIWLPSSETRDLHQALANSSLANVPICREGESFAVAAGLYAGGQRPVVLIQNTGFFESGDSIRGLVLPLGIPLPMIIGYRGYQREQPMTDTAAIYLEPHLRAWGIKYYLAESLEGGTIQAAFQEAWDISGPVAVLVPREAVLPGREEVSP